MARGQTYQKVKVKVGFFYSATYTAMPPPAALYNRRKWQLIGKSQWCGSAMLQLQHTPPPQSTTPGLHPVNIHQTAPPVQGSKHPITDYYSIESPWSFHMFCPRGIKIPWSFLKTISYVRFPQGIPWDIKPGPPVVQDRRKANKDKWAETSRINKRCITGSSVALHCCKAHSKSIGKMENSTPCKIVTPENFILKLGIRDYVENITHYINFHVHRFSGGFSTNR